MCILNCTLQKRDPWTYHLITWFVSSFHRYLWGLSLSVSSVGVCDSDKGVCMSVTLWHTHRTHTSLCCVSERPQGPSRLSDESMGSFHSGNWSRSKTLTFSECQGLSLPAPAQFLQTKWPLSGLSLEKKNNPTDKVYIVYTFRTDIHCMWQYIYFFK